MTMLPPSRLYLMALETRFNSTCLIRWRSAHTARPSSPCSSTLTARAAAIGPISETISVTTSRSRIGSMESDRLPDSICEISRTSLISWRRCWPADTMWSMLSALSGVRSSSCSSWPKAEDGGERRTQLVAHAGEELVLGLGGGEGLVAGPFELRLALGQESSTPSATACRQGCRARRWYSGAGSRGSSAPEVGSIAGDEADATGRHSADMRQGDEDGDHDHAQADVVHHPGPGHVGVQLGCVRMCGRITSSVVLHQR